MKSGERPHDTAMALHRAIHFNRLPACAVHFAFVSSFPLSTFVRPQRLCSPLTGTSSICSLRLSRPFTLSPTSITMSRSRRRSNSPSSSESPPGDEGSEKTCASCGRRMTWRKKWARDWETVRYCSDACRRRKVRPVDAALQACIMTLLSQRAAGKTICPSEAARFVAAEQEEETEERWRELMEPARMAARRLVAEGVVEITQKGAVVDPSTAKGPIRIRLKQ